MPEDRSDYFLVPPIWPMRQVQVLTGGSGVGKSTLLACWLNALATGEEILGYRPAFKTRPLYISCERSAEQLELSSRGDPLHKIEGWNMQCEVLTLREAAKGMLYKKPDEALFQRIMRKFAKSFRVACLDPILTFCTKPNDQNSVRNFLVDTVVEEILVPLNMTVIATAHPPKEREGQRIIGTRTKTAGSYAWGAYSSCGHFAEPLDPDDPECPIIRLDVTPRYAKNFTIHFERVSFGKIKIVETPDEAGKDFVLSVFLDRDKIRTADLVAFARKSKISERTVYRWLEKQQGLGTIEEVGRGEYETKRGTGSRPSN